MFGPYFIKHFLHLPPSNSTVSEDAGTEPRGGFFSPFMQMYFWPRVATFIQSHSPLCIATQSSLTAVGQKKASSHSLVFTGDTRNRDREKSSGQSHLFNIWTVRAICMDRTTCQPQVKLSLMRSIFMKIRPQDCRRILIESQSCMHHQSVSHPPLSATSFITLRRMNCQSTDAPL